MSDRTPDRRRHGYQELEKKLNQHVDEIEARFKKRYRGMLIAFSIIGLSSAIALVGFGIVLREQGRQQDRFAKQQMLVTNLSKANRELGIDIQHQRKDSIRISCQDTNRRNLRTKARLIQEAKKYQKEAPNEAAREEIRRSRNVSLDLIDLNTPRENCEKRVKKLVKPVKPVEEP